jgi:hypothetical protein
MASLITVGQGGSSDYSSIQDAIDHASSGDVIVVAAGTYDEHVTINKEVFVEGANVGVDGASNARGAESIITGGVEITAAGATLDGFAINGSYDSVTANGTDLPNGLLIEAANVTVGHNVFNGDDLDSRPASTTGAATDLNFTHNLVQNWNEGFYITNGSSGAVSNNTFVDDGNGVLSETTQVSIDHNSFTGSTGADVAPLPFTDATIANFVHDNTYSPDHDRPITVYLNGPDGQTVTGSNVPTTFHLEYHDGNATVTGGAGSDAISFADNSAPVTINLTTGTAHTDSNVHGAADTVSFTSIENAIGGSGDDTFVGTNGNNTLIGGGGNDTADYTEALSISDFSYDGNTSTWTLSTAGEGTDTLKGIGTVDDGGGHHFLLGTGNPTFTGGAGNDDVVTVPGATLTSSDFHYNSTTHQWEVTTPQGTDYLSGVEQVTDGTHTFVLVDPSGSFTTIQAAIDAASPGDTILIGAGTYNENVHVTKSDLTIENSSGETVTINGTGGYAGAITIDSGVTGTTIQSSDGDPTHFVLTGSPSGQVAALYLVGSNDDTSINGITAEASAVGSGGLNAVLTGGDQHNVTFESNVFSAAGTAGQLVYVNGAEDIGPSAQNGAVNFIGNTFSGDASLLLGMSAPGEVENNIFSGHSNVAVGLNETGVTVSGNTFSTQPAEQYIGIFPDARSGYNPTTLEAQNTFSNGHEVYIIHNGQPEGGVYSSIQAAIDDAHSGDTVFVGNGTYDENVALKAGVSLEGQSEVGVVINGTLSTPSQFDNVTVSQLTVEDHSSTAMLLDMTGTTEVTDSAFEHVTFNLLSDSTATVLIGNGQVSGSMALNDGNHDGNGLTFSNVTMNSHNHDFANSTAFAYTLFHSVDGAKMLLDGVSLNGTASGSPTGLGAQWNMSPNSGETADVTIENSSTSGGGNFYVSGMHSATIANNTFDGQGLALNGVASGSVTGNTFENISDDFTANGTQHRGLVIENAWGATGDSDITVTGNTFSNITADDGAIAFQRWTDGGGNPITATIDQLENIDIHGNTFTNVATSIYLNPTSFNGASVIPASFHGNQIIIGTDGADTINDTSTGPMTIIGGGGGDTINGGSGDTTYYAHAGDTIHEALNGGADTVLTTDSFTLPTNVENLTLLDGVSNTQTFDDMPVGAITNGENGWEVLTPGEDQEVVALNNGNHVFRMSSDPGNTAFGGPYSPALDAAAGEPDTGAPFDSQSISFTFQAVNAIPDGSRLEVDFGNAAGTDRNNFLVIESFNDGIRIAVSEPDTNGDFSGDSSDPAPNDWRELVSGVDPTEQHTLQMRLVYNDGADNDVIQIYLDGKQIGTTTTFENYRDSLGGDHVANATANLTDRVFFRPSPNGAPQDGPGGAENAGFYFDNLSTSVYNGNNNTSGTGNNLANVITGNSGDNTLTGLGGNDTLLGDAGVDTAHYLGTLTAANFSFDSVDNQWVVNASGDGQSEGIDHLGGIEIVTDGAGHRFLLAGGGSEYNTVAQAIAAEQAGDIVIYKSTTITSFSQDTGVLGDRTTAATNLTFTGTSDANATVRLYDGGTLIGITTADGNGNWSFATGKLATGVHNFTATGTNADNLTSQPSDTFTVNVDPNAPNHAPVVTVIPANGHLQGDVIAASSLFTATDPDGDQITQYTFRDSNMAANAGYFIVDGVKQANGTTITVAASDLANVSYVAGAGKDTLTIGAFDGQVTTTASLSITSSAHAATPGNNAPIVTPLIHTALHGQAFPASSLFSASDPDSGDHVTEYQIFDSGSPVSGHFVLNGVAVPQGKVIDITPSQLAGLSYQSGSGTDTIHVRAYDGDKWSPFTTWTVTAPVDHAPSVDVVNWPIAKNTQLSASSLFSFVDQDGDQLKEVQFRDLTSGATSGYFVVDGVDLANQSLIDLTAAQVADAFFQGGNNTTDNLQVRVSDGMEWSAWKSFTVSALDQAPVVTPHDRTLSGPIGASSLFTASDPDGDAITLYKITDTTTTAKSGYFVVDGVVQAQGTSFTITADQLADTVFVKGNGVNDTITVQAFDGQKFSTVATVHLTEPVNAFPPVDHVANVTVHNFNAAHGAVYDGATLLTNASFSSGDVPGNDITAYRFIDTTATATSGHFQLDGQALPAGKTIEVSADELSSLSFQTGSGADTLKVSVYDGFGWSAFKSFQVTAPVDHAPTITGAAVSLAIDDHIQAATTLPASTLFGQLNVSDLDGDTITMYQFEDLTAGSKTGHFVVDGASQPANTPITVLAAELDQVSLAAGFTAGTDQLEVRAFDGVQWSAWHKFTLTTHV